VLVANVNAGFQEIRTMSTTRNRATPQAGWANGNFESFVFAQCTANCATYAPSFTSGVILNQRVSSATISTASDGGVIAAVVQYRNFALPPPLDGGVDGGTGITWDLSYGECGGNSCNLGTQWTWLLLKSDVDDAIPQIASAPTMTAIVYGINNDTGFGECLTPPCNVASSWKLGNMDSAALSARPGLLLAPPQRSFASTSGEFLTCSAADCTINAPWSTPYTGNDYGNGSAIHLLSSGLPRIYGTESNQLYEGRCSALPCTANGNWSQKTLVSNASQAYEQLDVAYDNQDKAVIVYKTSAGSNNLVLMREGRGADGGFSSVPMPECGALYTAAVPVPDVSDAGLVRFFFHGTNSRDIRYYVQP
jgi:hypothetical protein